MKRTGTDSISSCACTAADAARQGRSSTGVRRSEISALSHSGSRLATDTRNTGLDFSDGSISNVCEVLPGS